MNQLYTELVRDIRDAVRVRAETVPKFSDEGNGAIRILAYPCCNEADDWLGGLSTFGRKDDIADYEHTFAITPGGSRVVTGVWDGVKQKVDCYAYSALKIAHCSLAQDLGYTAVSGLDLRTKYLTEDNGYGPHPGALCFEIGKRTDDSSDPEPFCGIYVCVSGADSKDDLKCAIAAVHVIVEYFARERQLYTVKIPNYSAV